MPPVVSPSRPAARSIALSQIVAKMAMRMARSQARASTSRGAMAMPRPAPFVAVQARSARGSLQVARARLEYPDPQLLADVKAEFPDKGVANVEEARALYSNYGYTYVDVRPALEIDEVGKFKVRFPLLAASHHERLLGPKPPTSQRHACTDHSSCCCCCCECAGCHQRALHELQARECWHGPGCT